jgi:hypothetical protein
VGRVPFDFHPAAAAKTLLPSPQFAIQEPLIDLYSGRKPGKKSHQAFSVRFSGSEVAQHKQIIDCSRCRHGKEKRKDLQRIEGLNDLVSM